MKEKPKLKETTEQWAILGTRVNGTQWFSSQRYFDRSSAMAFKEKMENQYAVGKLKVVRVLVTIETI